MREVLEHLGQTTDGTEDRYGCMACGHLLGPVTSDYRDGAMIFDDPIDTGQPPGLSGSGGGFLLRHYACPSCATLFEVEMLAAAAKP